MTVEPRSSVVALRAENSRSWPILILQSSNFALERVGSWAADMAQQFGAIVAALMGPAVLSVYAFVAWSLAANLGWTDTFVFRTGPLSNWMVWMGAAVLVSIAASILRKRSRTEEL
jgi:LPXTG-motif cell wall-anchored protein